MGQEVAGLGWKPQTIDIHDSVITPDYSRAYARLAPLVTEARAFLLERNVEAATEALNKARQVIDESSMTWLVHGVSDEQ